MPKSKKQWVRLKHTCGLAWDGNIESMKKRDDVIMGRRGFMFHTVERSGKLPNGQEYVTFIYVK